MISSHRFLREDRTVMPWIILLAVALRIPNITESLWYDEVMYSTSQGAPTLAVLWSFIVNNPPPPLYRTLLYFWTAVFGEQELIVRMPSLLFGVLSVGLTYWIAREYGSRLMATIAGLLLALSPVHVWFSQEATPYSMPLFFLLAALFLLTHNQERDSHWIWRFSYAFCLFAAVFSHSLTVTFLLPLTVIAYRKLDYSRFQQVRTIHLMILFFFVAYIAARYLSGNLVTGMYFLRQFTLFEWWMLFFDWFLLGNSLWPLDPMTVTLSSLIHHPALLLLQLLFLGIFLCGLLLKRNHGEPGRTLELFLLTCTLPVAMLFLGIAGGNHTYIERYLFPVLSFFLITVARGMTAFPGRKIVIPLVLFGLLLAVICYSAFLYQSDTFTVYKQNPDCRSTGRYLWSARPQLEQEVVVFAIPADDFIYYIQKEGGGKSPDIRYYGRRALLEGIPFVENRPFHVIKNLYWPGASDQVLMECFRQKRYELISIRSFKGVEVYTFVPRQF